MVSDATRAEVLEMNMQELRELKELMLNRYDNMAASTMAELQVGDTVEWFDKDGARNRGTVEKLKIKNVSVRRTCGALWRIPASMLTRVG